MFIRLLSSSCALLTALIAPAQSPLHLGSVPGASTAVGGAAFLGLDVWTPVTLTQLDFWTGSGTALGASVSVSIYLSAGGGYGALTPGYAVLIGTTVPRVTTAAGMQLIAGAAIVPVFASVTLPASPVPYVITLVPTYCSLGVTSGQLNQSTAELHASGGEVLPSFPFTGGLTSPGVVSGALHYTNGGTPINLQENVSYGAPCWGLSLAATGVPTPGGTLTFTTSNPTNVGIGLCILSTDGMGWYPGGVDLAIFGAPGCRVHADLSAGFTALINNTGLGLPGMAVTLPLPSGPGLLGLPFYAQSVWFDATLNAFGIATSNGVRIRIG
jgi:hypothetical protein